MLETLYELQQTYHYHWTDKAMFTQVMRCAAYFGRFEMLKWLFHELSKDPKWAYKPDMLMYTLGNENPDVELLSWIYEHSPEDCVQLNPCHMDRLVERGNLTVIKRLHSSTRRSQSTPWTRLCTTKAMDGAAKYVHLDVVRFLHGHRTEGCTTKAMGKATCNGHLEVVQFLHEHHTEGCSVKAMDGAALNGHLAVVRYLYEVVAEVETSSATDQAIGDEACTTDAMNQASMWEEFFQHAATNYAVMIGSISRNEYLFVLARWTVSEKTQAMIDRLFPSHVNVDASKRHL